MADPSSTASSPLVLLVHDDAGVSEALAIALEGIGATAIQVNRTGDARMVIQGAPGLTAVMSRCSMDLAQDQPLLSWVAEHRPGVALIAICSTPGHTHDHLPNWCQLLSPPFNGLDLKRALVEARLTVFESKA
jgi:DNA-binding NtrC family response regulator